MKQSCGVIQDLLPMYCDGTCSQTSKTEVELHLRDCRQCRRMADAMETSETVDRVADRLAGIWKNYKIWKKRSMKRKIVLHMTFFLCIMGLAAFFIFMYFTGSTRNAVIRIGISDRFERGELESAMDEVKRHFRQNFQDGELVELWYDEEDNQNQYGEDFGQMMIYGLFYVGKDNEELLAGRIYKFRWVLERNEETGEWRVTRFAETL